MLNEKDQLKKYIQNEKENLDNAEVPSALWENIEAELHPEKKRRGVIWWYGAAAGIAALFIFWFSAPKQEGKENLLSENQSYIEQSPSKDSVNEAVEIEKEVGIKNKVGSKDDLFVEHKKTSDVEIEDIELEEISFDLADEGVSVNDKLRKKELVKTQSDAVGKVEHSISGNVYYESEVQQSPNQFHNTPQWSQPSTEQYDRIVENDWQSPINQPLSTFSIDVDAAGYSNVRRFIQKDQLPPKDAVKIEEMVNYFSYNYPEPKGAHPLSITTEFGTCPWNSKHQLVHIGLKAKEIPKEDIPPSNLVFLIDVSGSMMAPNKIDLLKKGFSLLSEQLRAQDKVSIVVYAGASGLVLPPTSGTDKKTIVAAIDRLRAGGSTAGAQGIQQAYAVAEEHFIKHGNNRVILATDGDFNVGISQDEELVKLIEEKRKSGVFLTVLGFGQGNLQASKMEKLAQNGNGNFAYIDNTMEAKKVLVNEFGALYTVAKDVKLQVEFNPNKVKAYRLIGYENRLLKTEDFDNDKIDAGEMGAGHTVTALYELIPADSDEEVFNNSNLRYQKTETSFNNNDELMYVKFRYKHPDEDQSKLLQHVLYEKEARAGDNFYFSAAVAEFALLLRDSKFKSDASFEQSLKNAKKSVGKDPEGYRHEFIRLVEQAQINQR